MPTGHARADSWFDVWTGLEATMGPPYPSVPPIHIEGFADDDPQAEVPIEVIDLELRSAPVDMTTGLTAGDSGGGGGGGGGAGTTVTIDCTLIAGDPPVGGTTPIELMFEFTNPDGSPAQGTVVSSYIIDSFFDVWTELSLDDGGVLTHHLHGEIAPGQGASFDEETTELPTGIFESFFDVFVLVRADAPIV
ncbi:MAG: hypothetical protein IT577_05055, partial [Verrucomicrobiae bacterium]|nr:hypothetical protein [Verrucomicrobiae bacterium]